MEDIISRAVREKVIGRPIPRLESLLCAARETEDADPLAVLFLKMNPRLKKEIQQSLDFEKK